MIGENCIKEVAKQYGTPTYIFDIKDLHERLIKIKKILGDRIKLCYAMKANPFLISYIDEYVDKFEVCSPGEYQICKKEKILNNKIVMSGVYKSYSDIEIMINNCFDGVYTVESQNQFELLYNCAKKVNTKVHVLLRLTSGNQFGMDKQKICEIITDKTKLEYIDIVGIHYFSGTQKKSKTLIEKEILELDEFCEYIYNSYGLKIEKIEYGPGLFIDYFLNCDENYEDVIWLSNVLNKFKDKYDITVELGRYIAATCGEYITSVVDLKINNERRYCIVDGGSHHIRYYGQMLGIKVPKVKIVRNHITNEGNYRWNVCGALCTIHDCLLKDYETQDIQIGDLISFCNIGAYSVTETDYLFLSRELPLILIKDLDNSFVEIRKRIATAEVNSRNGGFYYEGNR
jgi:diaminopimelate decarboxylase